MDISLSERLDQVDPQLFLLLGQLPDNSWHYRIIRAQDPQQAYDWWLRQTGHQPGLILIQQELEAAIAGLVELSNQASGAMVWGAWAQSSSQPQSYKMLTTLAYNQEQARDNLSQMLPSGYSLAAVVDASPWLAELARMRAIAAGELPADVDLLG